MYRHVHMCKDCGEYRLIVCALLRELRRQKSEYRSIVCGLLKVWKRLIKEQERTHAKLSRALKDAYMSLIEKYA